ncbi:hypothetical protein LAV79_29080 [Peribacillus butanolivorans]|uniref:hypothetical protein n=1 Tax=Peribacillus butanolivorans TaxID=421767 RepID=UPI0030CA0F55
MANSANISANASVHQPIRDRTGTDRSYGRQHAGEAQACFRNQPGRESHGKLAHLIREGRINFRYTEID